MPRRRIRDPQSPITHIQPQQLWQRGAFQWTAVIICTTSVLFGIVTVSLTQRGYTQTPAMFYGMIVTGITATVLQLINLWRGRLLTTVFRFLWMMVAPRTRAGQDSAAERVDAEGINANEGEQQSQADTANLLKGITCSCNKKGQSVGVCHHCGRILCETCGYFIKDTRFSVPKNKPKEYAWHCLRCLRQYHKNEWGWQAEQARRLLLPSWL